MIYVSTACVKAETINKAVQKLVDQGYTAIELSGGTEDYPELEIDLLELKEKYNLKYLCHNYFPPPREHFVLNLASLDNELFQNAIDLCTSSIELSQKLGGGKYALHAGFLMDIKAEEFGNRIGSKPLLDEEECLEKFRNGFSHLSSVAEGLGVNLYVENNAMSISNAQTYSAKNPFMFTCLNGFKQLKKDLSMRPLLDIAHLKVSLNSHKEVYGEHYNLSDEFHTLVELTDYIHVSDNDGKFDLGNGIKENTEVYNLLSEADLTGKDITLEVYDGEMELRKSYELMNKLI